MSGAGDWEWKLREAIERIRTRYDHIGRKTGGPILAIVYPPEAERAVLKEWHMLVSTLAPEVAVQTIDVLEVTSGVVQQLGAAAFVEAMDDPMPGSDPTSELGSMWREAIVSRVREASRTPGSGRTVVVLEHLAALYPASGPRAVMQLLWDSAQAALESPVVFLIPGLLKEAKVYSFVGQVDEFMYRGDIL